MHQNIVDMMNIGDVVQTQVELWIDNAEELQRSQGVEIVEEALDYDLHRVTQEWLGRIRYQLNWSKVDSHIKDKLREDPTKNGFNATLPKNGISHE